MESCAIVTGSQVADSVYSQLFDYSVSSMNNEKLNCGSVVIVLRIFTSRDDHESVAQTERKTTYAIAVIVVCQLKVRK